MTMPPAPPQHHPALDPCPFLPPQDLPLTAACMSGPHGPGENRGPGFYLQALHYAQSLWLQGYPARSILLINRALGADLNGSEPILRQWPLPYAAIAWLLRHHQPDQFIGNPRRHWQHLATRMSGPRSALRTWRAWACWRMACLALPHMPADEIQLTKENLQEPTPTEIATHLEHLGHPGEAALWDEIISAHFPPQGGG